MKIVQLSDLHLTPPGQALFGSRPDERLEQAVDDICRNHADAAFCLLTGDLADAGSDAAYARLAEIVARLPMPAYPLVGNHDDRVALCRHFPNLAVDADGFVQTAIDTPVGRFLLLDTLKPGSARGLYCPTRRTWLARQLAASGDTPIWLAMHHPPLAVGIPSMDQYALREPETFWAVLAPHRERIRHLLVGHLHRPLGGSWHGIPFSCVRSPNHQVAFDMRTTDEVPGTQEAPGYAVVLIEPDSVVVHQHEFLYAGDRFWL